MQARRHRHQPVYASVIGKGLRFVQPLAPEAYFNFSILDSGRLAILLHTFQERIINRQACQRILRSAYRLVGHIGGQDRRDMATNDNCCFAEYSVAKGVPECPTSNSRCLADHHDTQMYPTIQVCCHSH